MPKDTVSVAERVITAVATEKNVDPLDLPPLYDAIDADALNAAINALGDGEVTFSYAGATVTVTDNGGIQATHTAPTAKTAEKSGVGVGL